MKQNQVYFLFNLRFSGDIVFYLALVYGNMSKING